MQPNSSSSDDDVMPPLTGGGKKKRAGGVARRDTRDPIEPYDTPSEDGPTDGSENFPSTGKNKARLKEFVFTINGDATHLLACWNWFQENHGAPTWLIVAREHNSAGVLHLQGAMVLARRTAFSTVKKWFPFRGAHIEPMRGTPEQSRIYCTKEDASPFEFGAPPMAKTALLDGAIERVRSGDTLQAIAQTDHAGSRAVTIHGRGLATLKNLLSLPRDPADPPCVLWFHGDTGTGKTRCAWEFGVAISAPRLPWKSPDPTLKWFDGYDGQLCAIIDDFRPKGVKFNYFLQLLDRYPLQVPIKGGFTQWCPKYIFITTPRNPENTFLQRALHVPEDVKQLERRISHVVEFDKTLGNPPPEWIRIKSDLLLKLDTTPSTPEDSGLESDLGGPDAPPDSPQSMQAAFAGRGSLGTGLDDQDLGGLQFLLPPAHDFCGEGMEPDYW